MLKISNVGFIADLLPNKYILFRFGGGKIYLNLKEAETMRQSALGIYEYQKTAIMKKYIKPGMNVIDLGSNKGYFTFLFAKWVGKKGYVLSVEPDSNNYGWIKKSMQKNKYRNIRLIKAAVSKRTGMGRLYFGRQHGNHSIKFDNGRGSVKTRVFKLDDLVKKYNFKHVDLIKIDVEGSEIEVIKGARQIIQIYKPILLIDVHRIDRTKLYETLVISGYKVFSYNDGLKKIRKRKFVSGKINEILAM